jgi:hypothetical protein
MTRLRFPQTLAFLEPKLTTGSLSPDRYPIAPAALTSGYHRKRVHAGAARERAANGRDGFRDAQRRRLPDGELGICCQMLPIASRNLR